MSTWDDRPPPAQALVDWHREAAERDAARLAQGPVDETETTDGPWSGTGDLLRNRLAGTG